MHEIHTMDRSRIQILDSNQNPQNFQSKIIRPKGLCVKRLFDFQTAVGWPIHGILWLHHFYAIIAILMPIFGFLSCGRVLNPNV